MAGYAIFRLCEYLTPERPEPRFDTDFVCIPYYTLSVLPSNPPDERFCKISNTIVGVPVTESNRSFFFLDSPPPAIRSYILGPDWESRIVYPPPDSLLPYGGGCILRPTDPLDEENHCLLMMKRCGAEFRMSDDTVYKDLSQKQIFGWPSTGGVWILRFPEAIFEGANTGDRVTCREGVWSKNERPNLVGELYKQLDMDAYCQVLKEYGAIFYEFPAKCQEVVQLGLWESDEEMS